MDNSQPGSAGPGQRKGKKVGFTAHPVETQNRPRSTRTSFNTAPEPEILITEHIDSPGSSTGMNTPSHSHNSSWDGRQMYNRDHLPVISQAVTDELRAALSIPIPSRPRPALRRGGSHDSTTRPDDAPTWDGAETPETKGAALQAYQRGKRLERDERVRSAPGSRMSSPDRKKTRNVHGLHIEQIPMRDLKPEDDSDFSDAEDLDLLKQKAASSIHNEAARLVQSHARAEPSNLFHVISGSTAVSGANTPIDELSEYDFEVPKPKQLRGGVLGALLNLYNQSAPDPTSPSHRRGGSFGGMSSTLSTPGQSPPISGASTPVGGKSAKPWYKTEKSRSTTSLSRLVGSSSMIGSPAVTGLGAEVAERLKEQKEKEARKRPSLGKRTGSGISAINRLSQPRLVEQQYITQHIAATIQRQKYLLKLCRALMQYGAPTHRLEEYMRMSARVLEIEAQFLYIPGSMIVSFDDPATHTTEVKLVRVIQGLDLGKLRDVHELYKDVVHDLVGVEDATARLNEIMHKPSKHKPLFLVFVYGVASASVGPFAFSARLIDLPICFFLGCVLGVLQLFIAPQSDLYSNVFEIAAAVITSFLARAFGSIQGGNLFCFSALAQSSIALILPGYTVLCASLELQSRSIVAGSVRMVYAIIYSLFLGFGITIGTALYGLIDENATTATTCQKPIEEPYFFVAVPIFTMCLIIINQAKWKQAPVMLIISFAGYMASYYSAKRFNSTTYVSNTLGALAIGVMANLYSRTGKAIENCFIDIWEDHLRLPVKHRLKQLGIWRSRVKPFQRRLSEAEQGRSTTSDSESIHVRRARKVGYSLAAAAMLPAIFVQVPSGIAVQGSLLTGISTAEEITKNSTVYGDQGNTSALTFGYRVVEVAIGITVGLFLSAIIVYPFGKRRSGLFSF